MWITRRQYEEDIQRACMETEEKIQLNLRLTAMEQRITALERKKDEESSEQKKIGF